MSSLGSGFLVRGLVLYHRLLNTGIQETQEVITFTSDAARIRRDRNAHHGLVQNTGRQPNKKSLKTPPGFSSQRARYQRKRDKGI